MPTNSEYLLTVYLNDHLAGATAGVALARRLARNHQGTAFQQQTADLAEQIMQDRRSLLEIMEALNIRPRKIKGALALLAERAGRLKLNGALFRRSALSSVTELEGMRLGVEGKTDGCSCSGLARRNQRCQMFRGRKIVAAAPARQASPQVPKLSAQAASCDVPPN